MIGQNPPLAEQGLQLVGHATEGRFDPMLFKTMRNERAFERFVDRTRRIRQGKFDANSAVSDSDPWIDGHRIIFPHHAPWFCATYKGDWRLQWEQGFGPFAYRAGAGGASLIVPCFGSVSFLVSGGASGSRIKVRDAISGYVNERDLPPVDQSGIVGMVVPGSVTYRELTLEVGEGGVFYGYSSPEEQPYRPDIQFDYSQLPPV